MYIMLRIASRVFRSNKEQGVFHIDLQEIHKDDCFYYLRSIVHQMVDIEENSAHRINARCLNWRMLLEY